MSEWIAKNVNDIPYGTKVKAVMFKDKSYVVGSLEESILDGYVRVTTKTGEQYDTKIEDCTFYIKKKKTSVDNLLSMVGKKVVYTSFDDGYVAIVTGVLSKVYPSGYINGNADIVIGNSYGAEYSPALGDTITLAE